MLAYIATNGFIVLFLYFSLFWSGPRNVIWSRPFEKWGQWIYYLGLDHAWHMFSPPPRAEMTIEAEILYESGDVEIWDTTQFEKSNLFLGFFYMRRQIYKWSVAADKIAACRDALASYLSNMYTTTNQKPVEINLYVVHQEVPAPENARPTFSPPENRFLIHKWINELDRP